MVLFILIKRALLLNTTTTYVTATTFGTSKTTTRSTTTTYGTSRTTIFNTSTITAFTTTTAFTTSGEVSGTNYTSGGATLTLKTGTPSIDGTTAVVDFDPLTFSNVSLTAAGALIYNSSDSNKAVCVLDFERDITATASDFTITFPSTGASNSIIRLA